jgi:hypothetical protein
MIVSVAFVVWIRIRVRIRIRHAILLIDRSIIYNDD